MVKEIKNTLLLTLIVLAIIATYSIYQWFASKSEFKVEKNATVLLERIQKVAKLTTVEGNFSELFEQKSFKYFDISPFQKKVLVRVKAKVAVGLDYEGLKIGVDSLHHTIWINKLPDPEILYIDHSLDYYDISEGLFVSFTVADYNQIQAEAKALIRQKASESKLLSEARAQGDTFMDIISSIAIASGWEVKVRTRPAIQ